MSKTTREATKEFGARLRKLMLEKGLTSSGAAGGVDVSQLASITGATYEMARRYVSGDAMPRAGKLHAIAQWLGIEASELAYGTSASIDEELLERCIRSVREAQEAAGKNMPPEKVARLVALIYKEAMRGGLPDQRSIELMAKAMM